MIKKATLKNSKLSAGKLLKLMDIAAVHLFMLLKLLEIKKQNQLLS